MKQTLTFCHGFGLSPSIFDPLRVYFEDYKIVDWDLGYFGPPCSEIVCGSVALGHSLGFFKLHEKKEHFKALISVGGFFDFLAGSRKRAHELKTLTAFFESSPHKALESFYRLMNYQTPLPSTIDNQRVIEDLKLLTRPGCYEGDIPIFALGAFDDPIITPAVFDYNFQAVAQTRYIKGGHLLMLSDSERLALDIKHFLGGL